MNQLRESGYHIAKSAEDPNQTYLGEGKAFVDRTKALLFFDHLHARDYAERIELELSDNQNVIVSCECPETIYRQHLVAVV